MATSIYGEGDKIALPPSVLEYLTSEGMTLSNHGNPWYFRIGIRNPNYKSFPSSPLLQSYRKLDQDDNDDDEDDDDEHEAMDVVPDNDDVKTNKNPNTILSSSSTSSDMYLDELKYKYLAYTYSTVIEFTQEEGYIGLPKSICDALFSQQQHEGIPTTRTIDPSKSNRMMSEESVDSNDNGSRDSNNHHVIDDLDVDDNNKTPGHVAYNAFDIPALPIEVQLIQYLPKGKSCTVIPSISAIQNGFYHLTDIKLVLEQSLIRTRGTLSQHDTICTWYRGKQYNLNVKQVVPTTYNAISCINTDIEIEFGTNPDIMEETTKNPTTSTANSLASSSSSSYPSGGYVLGSGNSVTQTAATTSIITDNHATTPTTIYDEIAPLIPEPIVDDTNRQHIVKIQIRDGSHISPIRSFHIQQATGYDLFAYTQSFLRNHHSSHNNDANVTFQIVTRYPRRIYNQKNHNSMTLQDMGITSGQEMLFLEYIE
jgi:Ubiquitin fusion degradation protein UFD1